METITKNHGFRDCGRKHYVGTLLRNENGHFWTTCSQLRQAFAQLRQVKCGVRKVVAARTK